MPLPINQLINQLTAPRYSNNNMILVSRAHFFFFSLTNTAQAKNTCIRTYYSIPLPIVPPFKVAISHRSGHNTAHQPTQPTNHYAIISLARRRTILPACLPARNALFLLEKGKPKILIGDQRQLGSSGSRGEEEKKPILNALRTPDTYILRCNACITPYAYPQPPIQPQPHFDIHTTNFISKTGIPTMLFFFFPYRPTAGVLSANRFRIGFPCFLLSPPFPFHLLHNQWAR